RLPLPGRDGRSRGEVRLDRVDVLPREAHALVGEHVRADRRRADDEHQHRSELDRVAAQLPGEAHRALLATSCSSLLTFGPLAARGVTWRDCAAGAADDAASFGTSCEAHGTS